MKVLVQFLILAFVSVIIGQSDLISEDIMLKNDSIILPGTLTYTKSTEKQPLVIFIHGSGNVDRNGNQAGANIRANYIKQLCDSITKNAIAFYRYDKRTATIANMKYIYKGMSFDAFIEDALIAINNFKNDKRFTSITLIGHSQGSTVALLAAQKGDVDRYVSLAGLGRKFEDFVVDEYRKASPEFGEIAAKHFKELNTTGEIRSVHPQLAHIFPKQNISFLQSWMQYNPSIEIQKLEIPILIVNGTKDVQVSTLDAEKLHEANPSSKLVIIENMNHVLKHIDTDQDNQKSYFSPDYSLSKQLIDSLTEFIKK